MEVGKFYRNKTSGRIIKALAVANDGSVFAETTKPSESELSAFTANTVGKTMILIHFMDWEEHVPVQTFWVNVYKDLNGKFTTGTVLYPSADTGMSSQKNITTYYKTVPIEV